MNRVSKNTALLVAVALLLGLTAAPLAAKPSGKSGLVVNNHFPVTNTVQVVVSNPSADTRSGYVTVNAVVNGESAQSQARVVLAPGQSTTVAVYFSGRVSSVASTSIFEDPNPV